MPSLREHYVLFDRQVDLMLGTTGQPASILGWETALRPRLQRCNVAVYLFAPGLSVGRWEPAGEEGVCSAVVYASDSKNTPWNVVLHWMKVQ